MSDKTFEELQQTLQSRGAAAAIDKLVDVLSAEKRYHPLFDALLMKKRLELGLPLVRPTSLRDVPEEKRDEFERYYIDSARNVGKLLLADQSISQAWNYFRAINEPGPVAEAIEALPENGSVAEEIVEVALFQGVAPVKGLKLFLASHGTCSTITAFDQQYLQLAPDVRRNCARVMVEKLYNDLRENVQHDVERRQPMIAPGQSLRELITGREWLFSNDSYHIDVSHLNAVVRFARALDAGCPELDLAAQLAEYGSRLAPQYQYAGNPPFTEFYLAHIRYFQALAGKEVESALSYFREKIGPDASETDTQLAAYALVDLLQRLGRDDEALDVACRYLADSAEEFGLSLPELCARSGRFDRLRELAQKRGDLVNYAAALIADGKQ